MVVPRFRRRGRGVVASIARVWSEIGGSKTIRVDLERRACLSRLQPVARVSRATCRTFSGPEVGWRRRNRVMQHTVPPGSASAHPAPESCRGQSDDGDLVSASRTRIDRTSPSGTACRRRRWPWRHTRPAVVSGILPVWIVAADAFTAAERANCVSACRYDPDRWDSTRMTKCLATKKGPAFDEIGRGLPPSQDAVPGSDAARRSGCGGRDIQDEGGAPVAG